MTDEPLEPRSEETPAPDLASVSPDVMVCPICATEYPESTRFCPLDGSVVRPAGRGKDDLSGRLIDDRYYLLEKVGEGGMGDVYLGEHVRTQRRCAVKVISGQYAHDPEALPRFVREATNAGRINHPSVATIYDFGETSEGLAYLAMEYVDGEPLSRLLERTGTLAPARAVEIARQVAEGVGAAHELGIVHRDLKPGNILITKDRKGADVVKVVDFGISRAPAKEEQRLTGTGTALGTPQYMSPEQLIGDPVDGRSDVYSLGCVLFEMLTGEHPFGGSGAQLITRRLTERPARVRDRNPEVPKSLDDLVIQALGRMPQERFPTMEAMREALISAPTGPVTTGPRRLVTWLGGDAITDAKTAPYAAMQTPGAAEGEDAGVADPKTGPGRRRRLRPLAVVGAVAGVILLIGGARLLSGDANVAGPRVASTIPGPVPDASPSEGDPGSTEAVDEGQLLALWAELSAAEEEDEAGSYAGAIARLEGVASRSELLLDNDHPGHPLLVLLVDSARAQIEATERRCEADRLVRLRRNQTPPECRPEP
jgi:hypothetical protein